MSKLYVVDADQIYTFSVDSVEITGSEEIINEKTIYFVSILFSDIHESDYFFCKFRNTWDLLLCLYEGDFEMYFPGAYITSQNNLINDVRCVNYTTQKSELKHWMNEITLIERKLKLDIILQ